MKDKTIKERVGLLEHSINGNGVKGITDRLSDLEKKHEEIIQEIRASERRQYFIGGGVMVGIWVLEHFFLK